MCKSVTTDESANNYRLGLRTLYVVTGIWIKKHHLIACESQNVPFTYCLIC